MTEEWHVQVSSLTAVSILLMDLNYPPQLEGAKNVFSQKMFWIMMIMVSSDAEFYTESEFDNLGSIGCKMKPDCIICSWPGEITEIQNLCAGDPSEFSDIQTK